MSDDMKKRAQQLSDEDLLKMIDKQAADYTPEALEAAKDEAEARGGKDYLYRKIDEEVEARIKQRLIDDEKRWNELEESSWQGDLSGSRTLKDETLAQVKFSMVRGAAGKAQYVIDNIQKNLDAARIPLGCRWGVVEVKTKGWVSRVKRNFLVVKTEEFPDYHTYISIRDFGAYLDCALIVTLEPGFAKKFLSKRLGGDEEALSRPKNVLKHQDLHSWFEVVSDCYQQAIDDLVVELGQTPASVRSGTKTFLDIW
jgi:hypothetical protein